MARKKATNPLSQPENLPSHPVDRRALEKPLIDIGRLLQGHEFDSIDEINRFIQSALKSGQPLDMPPSTPLEQAQDLMYRACDATGPQRVTLARKALEISPDCADAYVLLAEEAAQTATEARAYFAQGVEAGERALGREKFKEFKGHFWGVTETRPYMRARLGLAQSLWSLGEHQEAIAHMQALLRLNPGDNQGVRYLLSTLLLEAGDNEGLQKLLKKYKDDYSANWKYTSALLAFRQMGKSQKADSALNDAMSFNRFVPPYLLGKKRFPRVLPAYVGFGDENEAISYAIDARPAWLKTEGAQNWLQDMWRAFKP